MVETNPAKAPIIIAATGFRIKSALEPTATPPAKVAFNISYIENLPLKIKEKQKVVMQLAVKAKNVLAIANCRLYRLEVIAELKLGQYIHKKIVPIIPNKFDK